MELPKWEYWGAWPEDGDDTLWNVERALDTGFVAAVNIGKGRLGYQVSVRRDTDGWEVYYGDDLGNTIARAVMAGPQSPPPPKPKPPSLAVGASLFEQERAQVEAQHPELKALREAEWVKGLAAEHNVNPLTIVGYGTPPSGVTLLTPIDAKSERVKGETVTLVFEGGVEFEFNDEGIEPL